MKDISSFLIDESYIDDFRNIEENFQSTVEKNRSETIMFLYTDKAC